MALPIGLLRDQLGGICEAARIIMVAAELDEVLRILGFVGEHQSDGLEALLAAINVIAEEDVVALGRKTAVLKEAEKIMVLAP